MKGMDTCKRCGKLVFYERKDKYGRMIVKLMNGSEIPHGCPPNAVKHSDYQGEVVADFPEPS